MENMDSSDQAQIASADRPDAIRQGKEKAKEVVQAAVASTTSSSAAVQTTKLASSKSPPPSSSSRPESLSRKRSRSGSRKPNGSQHDQAGDSSKAPSVDPHLDQYIARDQLSAVAQMEQEDVKTSLIESMQSDIRMWDRLHKANPQDPGCIYGQGFQGYGNGWTARPPQDLPKIIYPERRKRPGKRRTEELRYNRRARDAQKDRLEDLVPIRLDLEIDRLRLRDTFTWNLSDRVIPTRLFAENLVEDFQIPTENSPAFVEQVHLAMQEQIQDFHPHPFVEEDSLDPLLPYSAYKNDDMRLLIRLNITIGNHTLVDQFDWDFNNPLNSPEDFAQKMAADLSLSGEFMTAIAHSIREQTQLFTKSLYIAGHSFDGRPIEDAEIRENLLPTPLSTVFRPYNSAKDYASYFYELNEADLERAEDAFQREQRQQKRSVNRRGGPSLPELKERPRTIRTQVVSSVVPGAADSIEKSGIYRPTTRATGRGRRSYRVDDEGSDISDVEDSEPDTPGRIPTQGTARTRGMRGAASAAQAAMRAAIPEALTPERQTPRQRRAYGWDYGPNPETGEAGMIVKLKMPRDRYRRWWRDWKSSPKYMQQTHQRQRSTTLPGTPRQTPGSMPPPASHVRPSHPGVGTPAPRTSSTDPNMPSSHPDESSAASPQAPQLVRAGSTASSGTASQQKTHPQPPAWLTQALEALRLQHPESTFIGTMRFNPQENIYQPRIKCLDCKNGIMYKTDESAPVANFSNHLKLPDHLEKVRENARRSAAAAV